MSKIGFVGNWFAANGDQTHRINYPLTKQSTVVDLGAFEGTWTERIASLYGCRVFAYEPVRRFYERALDVAKRWPGIEFLNYGLGARNEKLPIFLAGEGSSLYHSEGENEIVEIRDVIQEFEDRKLESIDLLKINIEGAEYDLLDHMLDWNALGAAKNIQVQFHIIDDSSEARRASIRSRLAATHELTYDFPFVWENWRLK